VVHTPRDGGRRAAAGPRRAPAALVCPAVAVGYARDERGLAAGRLPPSRALNSRYQDHVRSRLDGAGSLFFAGRLAHYVYVDMDDCMRQALDTAGEVLSSLRAATPL
jgi:hypothetical protein